MLSLWDALGVPSMRVPINLPTLVSYILPLVACEFAMAVLVFMPKTRAVRLAFWPIVAVMALRAAASLDMTSGKPEWKMAQAYFVVAMFDITTRALDWALANEPLARHFRPGNGPSSIIMDALDLVTNVRGCGRNRSHRLYIPRETRPKRRLPFAFYTLFSAVVCAFMWAISFQVLLSFARTGSVTNGLIVFDVTLPFFVRHVRAGIMTAFAGFTAYSSLQIGYDLCTIGGVLFLRQDPARWPPAFDAPWRATSLSDFWGRRWHQWCRHVFLFLGGYPLSVFLGRTGIVLGAFLASVVMHDMFLIGLDSEAKPWNMLIAFGMMAPGILAERAFYQLTGRKVGGVAGWVWTMTWLLFWFSWMLDGFAKAEVFDVSSPFDNVAPLREGVQRAVTSVDAWLHAI